MIITDQNSDEIYIDLLLFLRESEDEVNDDKIPIF